MSSLRFLCLACVAGVLLTGSLAQSATTLAASNPPAATRFPDYAARLRHSAVWKSFPLTVAFVRDANDIGERERWTRAGFDAWLNVTHGMTRYIVTGDAAQAQITIAFDPKSNNGYTTTTFRNGLLEHANVRIGVQRGNGSDIACIAAHEFGHALGMDGHSSDPQDVMYPVHQMGRAWRITARDQNTLAVLYSGRFSLQSAGQSP